MQGPASIALHGTIPMLKKGMLLPLVFLFRVALLLIKYLLHLHRMEYTFVR